MNMISDEKVKIITLRDKDYAIVDNIVLYDKMYYLLKGVDENEKILEEVLIVYKKEDSDGYVVESDKETLQELKEIFHLSIIDKLEDAE